MPVSWFTPFPRDPDFMLLHTPIVNLFSLESLVSTFNASGAGESLSF
jgi:hypothetical protein